jgi:hypothetical protein
MNAAITTPSTDLERRQAHFARRIAAALDQRALPHDIEQRLRVSRELAVARARTARALAARRLGAANAATAGGVVIAGDGQAALQGGPDRSPWWVRTSLVAFVTLLVAGLLAIDHRSDMAQIEAAAEIDAAILADDLPPDAYSDTGFRQFLRMPEQPRPEDTEALPAAD